MTFELTDEARRYASRFADVTGWTPRDGLVREDGDRVVVDVPPGEKGEAVGPAGATVERVLVVVDREEGATETLADHDVALESLVTAGELLADR